MKRMLLTTAALVMTATVATAELACDEIDEGRYICEGTPEQGPAGPQGPQGEPGEVNTKVLNPIYEQADNNSAAVAANRQSIADNARDIANNRKGVAAALSIAAMQHNPNYEGLQTSFGLGYWDGEMGYGALVGQRLSERVYGNIGVVGSGGNTGAVMSVTIQW